MPRDVKAALKKLDADMGNNDVPAVLSGFRSAVPNFAGYATGGFNSNNSNIYESEELQLGLV